MATDEWDALPSVDVFIPTYNEPVDIPKITAVAATNMIYPKDRFTVHLLDDGSTLAKRSSRDPESRETACKRHEELKKFCAQAGIRYHARPDNSHAKAGNLNHAFNNTSADIIAVLDCDHVPTQDFLIKTAHYFLKDPELALVQTPHFIINPDPLDRNLKMFYSAPSENEMFYRGILPEMDFWESAYFCGSAALLRRTCLETTDGFSGETVTEDAETSVALHSRGYRSIYLPEPLVCGLTPDIFSDFISQKIRWAQGMVQLLLLKRIFLNRGLKWYQKVCYFNCMFYWFFGFARLIFLIAPLFFLFFKLNVYNASLHQIVIFTIPYLMTLSITHNYLHGHVRWPLFSEIYEILQSIYIIPAIVAVIKNPQAPSFTVTAKGDTLTQDRLSVLAYPFHILFWLLCISLGLCIYKFIHQPLYRDTLLVTGSWILFNITMLFFTLGVVYEKRQVRKFHRARAWRPVRVRVDTRIFHGRLTDLSWTGAGMEIDVPKEDVDSVLKACRIDMIYRHSEQQLMEIPLRPRFTSIVHGPGNQKKSTDSSPGLQKMQKIKIGGEIALDDSIESTRKRALLVYGDSGRWKRFWSMKSRHQNTVSVLFYLMRNASVWSVRGGIEFFGFTLKSAASYITRFMTYLKNSLSRRQTPRPGDPICDKPGFSGHDYGTVKPSQT